MAVVILPMSAVSHHLLNHMTGAHGQSACSGLSDNKDSISPASNSKRPKLSLQTTSLTNTYGSLTRGLGPISTQATYTPTTANTLVNTWDLSIRPSPVSRTESPRPQISRVQTLQQPYIVTLPFGVKSILKNSPLPPRQASVSASPRDGRRKVFFPQKKQVSFRSNLEEVIVTKEYVARHYDLSSSEDEASDDEGADEASLSSPQPSNDATGYNSPPPSRKRKNRRDSGVYVEPVEQTEQSTPNQEENTPASTAASRSCKRRKWQWTLSNAQSLDSDNSQTSNSDVSDVEEQQADVNADDEEPTKEDEKDEASDDASCKSGSLQPSETEGSLGGLPKFGGSAEASDIDKTQSAERDETVDISTKR